MNESFEGGGHLDERAELHALGALEPLERAQVEAHVAVCADCARALGAAEATVTALDDAFVEPSAPPQRLAARIAASAAAMTPIAPRRAAPRTPWSVRAILAAAAAVLLAVGAAGGALVERAAGLRQTVHDSAALAAIATSHFNHESFTALDASAPVSKVLYARDGAWFYVVVDSATCDCRVVARTAQGVRDVGRPEVRAATATLFVAGIPRPSKLQLVNAAGRVVAAAALSYAR